MRGASLCTLLLALIASALGGCYVTFAGETNDVVDPDGGGSHSASTSQGDAGQATAAGIPCDVETILETHCWSCHGTNHTAPSRLVTYADLTAPSLSDPSKTEAEDALARMQSTQSPMPPSGTKPTTQEIATFAAWVVAGTPKGVACATDAGSSSKDAGVADANNPYNTPLVCTSKQTWNGTYDSTMHPGVACDGCHSWNIAGTVYPTAHEPDNCDGIKGGASVVVTDAHGRTATIAVNSAGNFLYNPATRLVAPFSVKVVSSAGTRVMSTKATSGDCNHCHTVKGANGAPGRIMKP